MKCSPQVLQRFSFMWHSQDIQGTLQDVQHIYIYVLWRLPLFFYPCDMLTWMSYQHYAALILSNCTHYIYLGIVPLGEVLTWCEQMDVPLAGMLDWMGNNEWDMCISHWSDHVQRDFFFTYICSKIKFWLNLTMKDMLYRADKTHRECFLTSLLIII